jgi:hypothetical protein
MTWSPGNAHRQFLINNQFRDGTMTTECSLVTFATLDILADGPKRGLASGLDIPGNVGNCATPGRDDACCTAIQTISPDQPNQVRGTSVAYLWPRDGAALAVNQFTLAHEIGHWLGLCHDGHKRFTEIMFTPDMYPVGLAWLTPTALFRGFQGPRFTGKDGHNLWRFILHERAGRCFAVPEEPVIE